MKFNKRFYKNQDLGKGKRPNEQSFNKKEKGFSKVKKVECFNCGGVRHYSQDCPSPKDIKKFMQATMSDSNFEESVSTTSKDARYNPNDMLAFVASMELVNDIDCDSNSDDDEFTDEEMAEFFIILLLSMKN